MTTKELYLRVCEERPMEANAFLASLEAAIALLRARYGDRLLTGRIDRTIHYPSDLAEESGLPELFDRALIDYILYLRTGDAEAKARATHASDDAYRTLWRERADGRALAHEGW